MHPFLISPGSDMHLRNMPTRDETLFPDLNKSEGKALLKDMLDEIHELQTRLYAEEKHRFLVVFQAMDTGGKDGTIRNVFQSMSPQGIRVASYKAPSQRELAHDFLWRIHSQVPENGETVVFNRSHYEDIVAVRVREIYPEERWRNRYRHVMDFERMLSDEGTKIIKIFLNISKEEQKERLQARLDDPAKHWKFNPADLSDRKLWDTYMDVYSDVIAQTSTEQCPWYVVPADRKWYRNLIVAQIVIDALKSLDMQYPKVDFDPSEIVVGD